MKNLLTERDVLDAHQKRQAKIVIPPDGIVTPAARDTAHIYSISILRLSPGDKQEAITAQTKTGHSGRVVVGCDHGGFELKVALLEELQLLGYEFEDVGTYSTDSVDYPDYALRVAEKVARDLTLVGLLIDGAGVGSAMAANKVPGIRAAACYDVYTARNSREHNFANILTLGSRVVGVDIARQILRAWLATEYGADRHRRRVDKIMAIDSKFRRA